jgi:Family of unknown function (DUF5677)
MRLPGEDELREHIRANLATEFQLTSELLNLGMGIFRPTTRAKPAADLEHFELWLCLGIVAKACRQYRAIIALAEISLGDVAESNGRMLLETMLAANFLMQPTVALKQNGKALADVPGYPLTTAFRTKLYMAHDSASTLKTIRGMAEYGDIDKQEAAGIIALAEKHVKEDQDELGPEWVKRQKNSRNYSGVLVPDLADSLGMLNVYHSFYRPACSGIHGADARKYVSIDEMLDGRLVFSTTSSAKGVAEALVLSSLALVEVLNVTNQRLGLGIEEKVHELAQRTQKMAHRLPNE